MSWPGPCHVVFPTPVDVDDRHVARFDERSLGALPRMGPPAHRVDALVLQGDERRGAPSARDLIVNPPLDPPPLVVGNQAEAEVDVEALHPPTV